MSNPTEAAVLHALRCIGTVSLDRLARTVGLPEGESESVLIDLAVQGLATRTRGPFGGWQLTESGRAEDAGRIATELAAAGVQSRPNRCASISAGACRASPATGRDSSEPGPRSGRRLGREREH